MAKDRDSTKVSHAHPEKEEKKKKKRSDEDGVHKSSDKKDKKEKKAKREALAEKALNEIQTAATQDVKSDEEGDVAEAEAESKQVLRPVGALVPFANPLADEKVAKKVFKSVKKGVYMLYPATLRTRSSRALLPPLSVRARQIFVRHALDYISISIRPRRPSANTPRTSGRATHPKTRRERSRESPPKIQLNRHLHLLIVITTWRRDPRRRHLAHGRHLAHPRALRRP